MSLRPYQLDCLSAIAKADAEGCRAGLIVLPCGSGKTKLMGNLPNVLGLDPWDGKMIVLVQMEELAAQTMAAMQDENPDLLVSLEKAEFRANPAADIIVASVQTVSRTLKRLPDDVKIVTVDECFPAGTIVDGKPIESLCPGDFVTTMDHSSGALSRRRVLSKFTRQADRLLAIRFSDGRSLVCTPNHPIYSPARDAYLPASEFTPNDMVLATIGFGYNQNDEKESCNIAVPRLRKNSGMFRISGPNLGEEGESVLLRGLQNSSDKKDLFRDYGRHEPKIRKCPDDSSESDAETWSSGKGKDNIASNGMEASGTRRQWTRPNRDRTDNVFGVGVAMQRHSQHAWRESNRITSTLQDRRRERDPEDRSGDRWIFPFCLGEEETRPKENEILGISRVESITVLEPGGEGRFERLCPEGIVYNLEVEHDNNYFANGVLVHNCHHAISEQHIKVLKYLRVLKGEPDRDPKRRLYGVTATPRRADGYALDRIFDKIVYRKSIREMIAEKFLCEPVAYRVVTGANLDSVHVRAGDFATGELSQTMNTPELNALVVQKYLEYGAGLPALAYTVDIQHSEDLAATFRNHGLHFEAISSNTPWDVRKRIIDLYREGKILGLASCQVLLESFDAPIATVALFDRPTCSGLLYQQALGRVLRPYPAPEAAATHSGYVKQSAIIVDFVGASLKHRLYTASTLFGLNPDFNMEGRRITRVLEELDELQQKNPTLDMTTFTSLEEVKAAVVSVDLWKPAPIPKLAKSCSRFLWMALNENLYRLSAPGMCVFLECDQIGKYNVWRHCDKCQPDGHMTFQEAEDAFAYADSLIPNQVISLLLAKSSWRKQPPTEQQARYLWVRDPVIKKRFSSGDAFHRYATHRFEAGNTSFSKGNISLRIDIVKRAKETAAAR